MAQANNIERRRNWVEDKLIARINRECQRNQSAHVHNQAARHWYQTERTAQHTSRRRPLATVGDMIRHQAERSKSDSMLQTLGAGFAG
jgi:hypothetical protein